MVGNDNYNHSMFQWFPDVIIEYKDKVKVLWEEEMVEIPMEEEFKIY